MLLLRIAILICLFASGCQVHQRFSRSNVPASSDVAQPAKSNWDKKLLDAAKAGDYVAAAEALRHGASPNTRGFFDVSPLIEAVFQHHTTIAKLLLDHGADPNQPKKDGVTPIFLATVFPPKDSEDLSLATLLVERGADVNRSGDNGQTPILWVAFYGHVAIANFLVMHGANVNVLDRFGATPLSMAERQQHSDMIAFLISHGATAPPTP